MVIAAMVITGCGSPATPEVIVKTVEVEGAPKTEIVVATPEPVEPQVEPAGPKVLRMGTWGPGDIPTIDPALAVDLISIQIAETTTNGLVRQNEVTAELEPGMATSWDVSEDGLTYTFHLRDNFPWVKFDGKQVVKVQDCSGADRMVTADDFAYGILRTLNPKTASDYAYVLTAAIDGAANYNAEEDVDPATVAVKALDPTTLEIKFLIPAVYNLNIAGLWVAHAQPKWLIEGDDCTQARGDRWTETGFFQGYGPYVLKEWVHDNFLSLVKNPFYPGTPESPVAKIDEILWTFLDVSPALAEYEAGNMDVTGVPSGDLDRILADPAFSEQLGNSYTIGTEFYTFNTALAPTDDARVRLALSLAIDRQSLVDNVSKSGEVAYWFSHPGAAGAPKLDKYPDLGVRYDPDQARQLMDEYLAEKNLKAEDLQLVLMFNTSESHKKRAEAIQQMWKDVLGVTVQLTNQETKVYYGARKEGKENIYRSSWVQDYPDANNFLREVFGVFNETDGAYVDVTEWREGAKFDAFMELVNQAATETDPVKRMDLYAQAEQIFVIDEAVVAPLYWYKSYVLVQPRVQDIDSITGYDHYEKWDIVE